MTVVITILADDNARNRRRARRVLQREQAMQDDSLARKVAHKLSGGVSGRVAKAMSVGMPREHKEPVVEKQKREWHNKPTREMGITCSGRQKMKGKSIPLI
ncbi:hypothetical protein [Cedecea neteri]|uniref:hypothetical protein n=1 Tax=Cedecea neteri TaxID=158822 RepID=UPI00289DF2D6|nr:hypothetical protein [Cedecea neteri]